MSNLFNFLNDIIFLLKVNIIKNFLELSKYYFLFKLSWISFDDNQWNHI
jgi:hypothetical protein